MILNKIDVSVRDIPKDVALELDDMMRDAGEFDCQFGNVRFKAVIDRGAMIKKFVPMSGIGFEFSMRAGRFRINSAAASCPLETIETMANAMGWIVQASIVNLSSRDVKLSAVKGHANICDLIIALDSGLLPYKLRVIEAKPTVAFESGAGRPVYETLELKFGW